MINDFNISFLVNVENPVSDSSELLSYAVIDGVKHTARMCKAHMLVKFDETDFGGFKINVPTYKELDVLHSQSDGNYAVESSFSSEYERLDFWHWSWWCSVLINLPDKNANVLKRRE